MRGLTWAAALLRRSRAKPDSCKGQYMYEGVCQTLLAVTVPLD